MDRGQLFNGLEFNNDCATHHQIGTKTVVEGDALIYEADALLTLDLQSAGWSSCARCTWYTDSSKPGPSAR
jgi:hypothetical protein